MGVGDTLIFFIYILRVSRFCGVQFLFFFSFFFFSGGGGGMNIGQYYF